MFVIYCYRTKYGFFWHPCHILSIELWWPICKYSSFAVDRKYQNGQSRNNYIFPQFNLRYKRQWINAIFLRDQRSLLSQFLNVIDIFIWRHCTRIRIIDIVTQSVVCYCYCEHTYIYISLCPNSLCSNEHKTFIK